MSHRKKLLFQSSLALAFAFTPGKQPDGAGNRDCGKSDAAGYESAWWGYRRYGMARLGTGPWLGSRRRVVIGSIIAKMHRPGEATTTTTMPTTARTTPVGDPGDPRQSVPELRSFEGIQALYTYNGERRLCPYLRVVPT